MNMNEASRGGLDMYLLIYRKGFKDSYYIKIDDFYIGKTELNDEDFWCSIVEDEYGFERIKYCDKNRGKSVEGLLKLMIYETFNNIVDPEGGER